MLMQNKTGFRCMKNKFLYTLFLIIAGCSSFSKKQEENIQGVTTDNVFFSKNTPALSVSISREFSYFGHLHENKYFPYTDGSGGSYHNIDSYYFVEDNKNKEISKIITIETKKIDFGEYKQDTTEWMNPKINLETLNYLGESYQAGTTIANFACNDTQRKLFTSKGYILPSSFLIRTASRRFGYNNQYLFRICYAEDIDIDPTKLNNAILNDSDKLYLDLFSKRASNSIRFSNVYPIKNSKLQLINLDASKTFGFIFNENRKYKKCDNIEICANLITDILANNFSISPNKQTKTNPVFKIHLDEAATVQHIELIKSSGDRVIDNAATDAIQKSSPFPELTSLPSNIFNKYFKTITITFDLTHITKT